MCVCVCVWVGGCVGVCVCVWGCMLNQKKKNRIGR